MPPGSTSRKATLHNFFGKTVQFGGAPPSAPVESADYSIYFTGRQAVLRPSGLFKPAEFLKLMGYPSSACVRQAAVKHGAMMKGDDGQWFLPRDENRSEEQVLLPCPRHNMCLSTEMTHPMSCPTLCLTCVLIGTRRQEEGL